MNEMNLALLTQTEIDALIEFLSFKKSTVTNEILNQDSIDKLIHLMRNNNLHKLHLDTLTELDEAISESSRDLLMDMGIRNNTDHLCLLTMEKNELTGFLELFALNTNTQKQVKITPKCLEENKIVESSCSWGYSIPPVMFDNIAANYGLKYSEETYGDICSLFALANYGDAQICIPNIFLPANTKLLNDLEKQVN